MQEQDPTPQLNVNELYRKRQSRDAARLKAYNKILDIIHHRIRTISELPNSPCSLLYTIPPFIMGLPRIDLEDCVVYLVYQLRMAGFDTRYTYPNLLNINWSHHEKSYILEQSPIMQAMIESEEKKAQEEQKKRMFAKKLSKTFGPGNPKQGGGGKKKVEFRDEVIIGAKREPGAPSVGQLPSASEYIPPVTFMRQMSEPPKVTSSAPQNTFSNTVHHTSSLPTGNAFADLWKN
jgi:hypothetical protein